MVRGQAVGLIRSLITMCSTLKPLPKKRILDITVEYYDDITPESYQPKHFKQPKAVSCRVKRPRTDLMFSNRTPFLICVTDVIDTRFAKTVKQVQPAHRSLSIGIGSFQTPFHGLKLTVLCEERKIDPHLLRQVLLMMTVLQIASCTIVIANKQPSLSRLSLLLDFFEHETPSQRIKGLSRRERQ